jgi:hypothetical protein
MGAIANAIAARVDAMVGPAPAEGEATEAEPEAAAPATEGASPPVVETPVANTPEEAEAQVKAARALLFKEKLNSHREKSTTKRALAKARQEAAAAKADREAAAAERAKYEGLKSGSFKETLAALGRDPRKTFEEMQREAIEASTPEAQARREREELQREIEAKLTPLQQEVERLRAREAAALQRSHEQAIVSSYHTVASDPAFRDLRIEYPDETLIEYARHYDKNPHEFHELARQYKVPLTSPERGFSMHEILSLLSAVQAEHVRGMQARRQALNPAGAQAAPSQTVNGTAPRRNAGTAIGNELASARASTGPAVSGSVRERIAARREEEIRRSERR